MLTAAFNNVGAERATDCTEATICRKTPWHPERRSKKSRWSSGTNFGALR
jgi:hypothetical protein